MGGTSKTRYSRLIGSGEDRIDRIESIVKIEGDEAESSLVLLGLGIGGNGIRGSGCVSVLIGS